MLKNYLKLAWKVLLRRKTFTAISLIGISLTLVVLMVATALLDNFFSPRAPESRLDRALGVARVTLSGKRGASQTRPGYWLLDRYIRPLPGAERVTVFSYPSPIAIFTRSGRVDAQVKRADGEYWRVLDFHFLEGGPFTADDDRNANLVAVINTSMRDRLLGGAPAVGKTIELGARRFRVIGVVPDVAMTRDAAFAEIWVPIGAMPVGVGREDLLGDYRALVLARSRADFPQLRRAFAETLRRVPLRDPRQFTHIASGLDSRFESLSRLLLGRRDDASHPGKLRLILLLMALAFVALPVLNLVTINLSRILERAAEIGVRKAFGASSRALVGQFLVENVVLTLLGGAAGFVLSAAVLALLNQTGRASYVHFELNLRIFVYALLVATVFGVLSGIWPAFRMARMQPIDALRGGAK